MNLKDKFVFIDVDDVLVDTQTQFLNCLIEQFGENSDRYSKIKDQWEMATVLTSEECDYLWGKNGYRSERFHKSLQFKPQAVDTVTEIMKQAKHTFVLSDCPIEVQSVRNYMIKQVLPNIQMYFTHHNNSQSVSKSRTKAQMIKYLLKGKEANGIVIEDSPFHIKEISQVKKVESLIVFSMPYNKTINNEKIHRVNSWQEVRQVIENLS